MTRRDVGRKISRNMQAGNFMELRRYSHFLYILHWSSVISCDIYIECFPLGWLERCAEIGMLWKILFLCHLQITGCLIINTHTPHTWHSWCHSLSATIHPSPSGSSVLLAHDTTQSCYIQPRACFWNCNIRLQHQWGTSETFCPAAKYTPGLPLT